MRYTSPSYDWPDHHYIQCIITLPCECQIALYADTVRRWQIQRTMWWCTVHTKEQ